MPLPSLYSSLSSFFLKQYRIRLYFDCLKFILSVVRSTLSYCNVVNNKRPVQIYKIYAQFSRILYKNLKIEKGRNSLSYTLYLSFIYAYL